MLPGIQSYLNRGWLGGFRPRPSSLLSPPAKNWIQSDQTCWPDGIMIFSRHNYTSGHNVVCEQPENVFTWYVHDPLDFEQKSDCQGDKNGDWFISVVSLSSVTLVFVIAVALSSIVGDGDPSLLPVSLRIGQCWKKLTGMNPLTAASVCPVQTEWGATFCDDFCFWKYLVYSGKSCPNKNPKEQK